MNLCVAAVRLIGQILFILAVFEIASKQMSREESKMFVWGHSSSVLELSCIVRGLTLSLVQNQAAPPFQEDQSDRMSKSGKLFNTKNMCKDSLIECTVGVGGLKV